MLRMLGIFSKVLFTVTFLMACVSFLIAIISCIERSFIFDSILVHPKLFQDVLVMLAGILFALTLVSVFVWIFIGRRFSEQTRLIKSAMILTTILGVALFSTALSVLRIASNSIVMDQSFAQGLTFDNHVYHLISYSALAYTGDTDLRVFECDLQDIICSQIHQIKIPWTDPKSREINSGKKALIVDPIFPTITLQINGETVFVHPVN